MGIALGAGSNKSCRTARSKLGAAISSGGGCGGCGQIGGGNAPLPMAAQPASVSAQPSDNSIVLVLCILHFPGEDQTNASQRFVLFALALPGTGLELGALVDDLGSEGVALGKGGIALRHEHIHHQHEQQIGDQRSQQTAAQQQAGHQMRPSHNLRSAAARRTSPRTRWPPAYTQ